MKSLPEAYIHTTFNRQKKVETNFEQMKEDTFKSDDEHDFKISGISTTHGRTNMVGTYVKKRQWGNHTYLTLMLSSFFFGKIRES